MNIVLVDQFRNTRIFHGYFTHGSVNIDENPRTFRFFYGDESEQIFDPTDD